jgi:hypothetical protein
MPHGAEALNARGQCASGLRSGGAGEALLGLSTNVTTLKSIPWS